jgi:two-component system response regulator CpxR
MRMERVLVIDDDEELCELVAEYLGREGFAVEAEHEGAAGAARALSGEHALVVLDVMLPGLNGFDVLRRVRAAGARVPVLMLTARGSDVDRIVGLEIGADDYLPKPFNPRELVARIRAILRRARPAENAEGADDATRRDRITVGDIELDRGSRSARRRGTALELTSVEFDLLELLLRAAGAVVARDALSEKVLGRKLTPFDRSIDVHVSNLRRKLGPHPDGADRIKTVRSVGYIYTKARVLRTDTQD